MRDFRRKDKKKTKASSLRCLRFLVIARFTRSDKSISCYMRKPPPGPAPSHKQKAHQTMGFLLVKLSIPGGNAVVTSSGSCPIEASLSQSPEKCHLLFPGVHSFLHGSYGFFCVCLLTFYGLRPCAAVAFTVLHTVFDREGFFDVFFKEWAHGS